MTTKKLEQLLRARIQYVIHARRTIEVLRARFEEGERLHQQVENELPMSSPYFNFAMATVALRKARHIYSNTESNLLALGEELQQTVTALRWMARDVPDQ